MSQMHQKRRRASGPWLQLLGVKRLAHTARCSVRRLCCSVGSLNSFHTCKFSQTLPCTWNEPVLTLILDDLTAVHLHLRSSGNQCAGLVNIVHTSTLRFKACQLSWLVGQGGRLRRCRAQIAQQSWAKTTAKRILRTPAQTQRHSSQYALRRVASRRGESRCAPWVLYCTQCAQ